MCILVLFVVLLVQNVHNFKIIHGVDFFYCSYFTGTLEERHEGLKASTSGHE